MCETKVLFDSPEFEAQFHSELPLGAFLSPEGTLFRLWAPTAEQVTVRLYPAGDGGEGSETHDLVWEGGGTWMWETERNLDGVYYDYEVTVDGVCRETADPYARACGCNGLRSMVIDLRRTDPPGWKKDAPPPEKPETVIYEIHVKDFSWDPASGVPAEYRGKFKALTLEHTTLNGDGEHPTCLAYLRELGITHVQLMPVYDSGSVDEGGDDNQFNWGYDPVNYNVPEGSYSTDPYRGEVRIRELKEAVEALHKNGFRVIMDVVYNHTFHLDSWRTVPWYHYRQRADGTPSDGSACGNDLASERSMCARYILDSVLYWAEEYHMDGFRFDLMGLLDVKLMNKLQKELDRRWGKGEKLLYGEPWSARGTAVRPGTLLADKKGLPALDPAIGAFCDATRDAVKGPIADEKANIPGFVNGGGLDGEKLLHCLRGWAGEEGPFAAPAQTITYLSCHDDWTLWDKLVLTMDPLRRFDRPDPELLRANRLAAAICFTCQGRLFLLSGEEFARTKQGVRDSVRSPLEINRLDWRRAWENRELADYYRGLIALRMLLPGLCDKSDRAPRRIGEPEELVPDCVTIQVDNGGRWRRLFLAYSACRRS